MRQLKARLGHLMMLTISLDSVAKSLYDIVKEALPEMNIDLGKATIQRFKILLDSKLNKT